MKCEFFILMISMSVFLSACSDAESTSASSDKNLDAELAKIAKRVSFPSLSAVSSFATQPKVSQRIGLRKSSAEMSSEEYCSQIEEKKVETGTKGSGEYQFSHSKYVDSTGAPFEVCAADIGKDMAFTVLLETVEEKGELHNSSKGSIVVLYATTAIKMELDVLGVNKVVGEPSFSYGMKGPIEIDLQKEGGIKGKVRLSFGFLDNAYTCTDIWSVEEVEMFDFSCDILKGTEKVGAFELTTEGIVIKNAEGKKVI